MTEQVKLTYSPIGNLLDKQVKTNKKQWKKQRKVIEEQGERQLEASSFSNKQKSIKYVVLNNDSRRETIDKITLLKELEEKVF